MPRPCPGRPFGFLPLLLLWLATACDNVGRAFDPSVNPGEPPPGSTTTSNIAVVPTGGDARDGRPKVRATFPTGGGWPTTVPIVVEFSESMNEASLVPTSATANDGKVVVRVAGATQTLPCSYSLVAGGRLLLLRPATALSNANNATYEVALLPGPRDADGVRIDVPTNGTVLASFQVNQDPSITNGRILATFPRDNQRDAVRETDLFVVFDRPPTAASITTSNLLLRPQGGTALAGATTFPLQVLGVDDPRVLRFRPDAALLAAQRYELVVDETITFGQNGRLDFRGRTPFASFETIGPAAPAAVELANPTTGYANQVNRNNATGVRLRVTTPSDAVAGDVVVARIYGGDADTTARGDLKFYERRATVPGNGTQQVELDFSALLGTLARPEFDEGTVDFAAQMRRGTAQSGYTRNDSNTPARFDITAPTVTRVGPPSAASGNDVFTDLEHLALYGTASEELGAAELTDGVNPAKALFAASADGRFVMEPLALGRLAAPRGYSLLVTDLAGNLAQAATTGNVVQRGLLRGTVAGTLVVEAYDDATLQPVAGATVLVDPGTPLVPATGQLVGTTDANGRAEFTGLATGSHTVTVVRAGYDLITLYATAAEFVSLPLRPLSNPTATFQGNVVFPSAPGATVLVGHSGLDDPLLLGITTASASPGTIPATAIRPNRPQLVTAFGGGFEPTATPSFLLLGYQMLGATGIEPTPPAAPASPGGSSTQTLAMLANLGSIASLTNTYSVDFGQATGLDTANLVGGKPLVRVLMATQGFGGQVLNGVGFATLGSGAEYTIDGSFGLPATLNLGDFGPVIFFTAQARDTAGRVARHRALVTSLLGLTFVTNEARPMPIPTVTAPGGPLTGSPAVEFVDGINASSVTTGIGCVDVVARDPAGRSWRLLVTDTDAAGGTDTVQFPDLATAAVAGLATGTWSVRAEARIFLGPTGATAAEFVLSERQRQEVTWSRGVVVDFAIQ